MTNQQLLADYTGYRSEPAFAELVRRHVDFVYSAAVRLVRDPHLAEDVTQSVFVALAQNAPQLTDRPVLSGWLHRTTRNLAANAIRAEVRRRIREQEAATMNELIAPDATWEDIAPQLDVALDELAEPDRDALLLRYFERKSAREMAQILAISDEAAQKRVNRALDRLRDYFAKRKVTVGAGGLVVMISANAVQAAPAGLITTISAAALLTGTTASTSAIIAAATTKTVAMTTLQKTLVTITIATLAGTGIYEARQATQLRAQNQSLQQTQATLIDQNQQLQRERDLALNPPAKTSSNNPDSNQLELLKLRGEVGRLRQQAGDLEKLRQENQKLLAQVATQADATNQLSEEDRFTLLQTHVTAGMNTLLEAIKKYATNHDAQYPENFAQLIASGDLQTTNFAGNLGLNDFELVNDGRVDDEGHKIIINLRVRIPRNEKTSAVVWGRIANDGVISTKITHYTLP